MHLRPSSRRLPTPTGDSEADATEIIAVDQFIGFECSPSDLAGHFSTDADVLEAPELDDLNDLFDELPRDLVKNQTPAADQPRVGLPSHRRTHTPRGPAHCRLIIAAVAGGAAAAGATGLTNAATAHTETLATSMADGLRTPGAQGIQIVQASSTFDVAMHEEELVRGAAFAQERAAREARLRRPQFVFPTSGILTSEYGTRWGTLHAGLDIANAIGTPIYAASDGEVIAAGPTPGFGMWVKIRDTSGTVTLYGHIDTTTVEVGQRVLAGDQIATMGNRGNSTGPHLHFEVHRNGVDKIDPTAWLQERGVSNV